MCNEMDNEMDEIVKLKELKWLRPDRQSCENAPWKQFFRRLDVYSVAKE